MDGNGTERKRVRTKLFLCNVFPGLFMHSTLILQKFFRLNLRVKVHISLLTKATKIHPGGVITEQSEGMSLSSRVLSGPLRPELRTAHSDWSARDLSGLFGLSGFQL